MPESISTLPNTLALLPMPTAWWLPLMTARFQYKLVEESLFCLPKWAEIDDPALCSSVCERLTWIDFETCESGRVSSSPLKRLDQLAHTQSVKECVSEPLRLNVIVATLVTRIPAIIHMMFAPRAITAMVAFILSMTVNRPPMA